MIDNEINTLLDLRWNTSIIAKPTFKQGQFDPNKATPREIRIQDLPREIVSLSNDGSMDSSSERFLISLCENHTDALLSASEVKRILHQENIANGSYRILSSELIKIRTYTIIQINCVKTIFKEVTTW